MRGWFRKIVFCLMVCSASTAFGASIVGKVISFDPNSRRLLVEEAKDRMRHSFVVPAKTLINQGGKKLSDNSLILGTSVTVYVNDREQVTSISVRKPANPAGDSGVVSKPSASSSKPTPTKSSSKNSTTKPAEESDPATDADNPPATSSPEVASTGSTNRPSSSRTPRKSGLAGNATTNFQPGDWPSFDGAARNNQSQETGLLAEWPASGPELAWSAKGLGEGFASVSVVGDRVYGFGNVGQNEAVTALDLRTGDHVWQRPTGSASRLDAGNGPRGTPTVDGNRVYALGGNGDLSCLQTDTGERVWSKNILQEFNGRNIQWGISESVLIDGDRLICTPGGTTGTMVALNKETGRVEWRCVVPGGVQAGYSSAIVADVGNVRQYIQFTSRGVIGVRATDGTLLWTNDASANPTANCSSPLFDNNLVFSASGYQKGGAAVRLASRGQQVQAQFAYHTSDMKSHHGGMVLVDGHVYGSSDPGILTCLDVQTGRVKWQNRSVGKGALTYADGRLYVRSERGPVALVTASDSGYEETGRFDQPEASGSPTWAHPVVAHGKLFLRDQGTLLAYDIKQ